MRDLVEESVACVILSMTSIKEVSFGEKHTSCRGKGVIFLVAPCLQLVCFFCVWKVILCVIASEEERAKPNGFGVTVVFGDRDVGDRVTMKRYFSNHFGEYFDFFGTRK